MNFIQALEALRQGKKVRCKSWPKSVYPARYIYFHPKNKCLIDSTGYLAPNDARLFPCDLDSFEKDDWEVYDPPLTIAERLYLNLLYQSEIDTDRLKYISLESEEVPINGKVYLEYYLACYLFVEDSEEYEVQRLPNHTRCRDELFKNLELGRKYTPEELGIRYAPMGRIKK